MKRLDKACQRTIDKMTQLAIKLTKEFDWVVYSKIWDLCGEWNDKHPECEIFLCDYSLDSEGNETNRNTGIMIEDDYYLYSDEV